MTALQNIPSAAERDGAPERHGGVCRWEGSLEHWIVGSERRGGLVGLHGFGVTCEKIVERWVDCVCGAVSGSRGVVGER